MASWQPNGYIAPREFWLPEFQGLTDEEAQIRHREILEIAARIPGLDEIFAPGSKLYIQYQNGELTWEEFIREIEKI